MPIAVRADLQARLKEQAYTRLFARNGGGTVDTTFADLCLAEAESEFLMITEAAFPDGFTAPVDVAIVGAGSFVITLSGDPGASHADIAFFMIQPDA